MNKDVYGIFGDLTAEILLEIIAEFSKLSCYKMNARKTEQMSDSRGSTCIPERMAKRGLIKKGLNTF